MITNLCLCGSGQNYDKCCQLYHKGAIHPENALKLMKSRYVAYALNVPHYIIDTTHPDNPYYEEDLEGWIANIDEFSKTNSFDKLDIVNFQEMGDVATVTFTAHLKEAGRDNTYTEKSLFEKVDGKWLYKMGEIV